jgi:hypothetical protein
MPAPAPVIVALILPPGDDKAAFNAGLRAGEIMAAAGIREIVVLEQAGPANAPEYRRRCTIGVPGDTPMPRPPARG